MILIGEKLKELRKKYKYTQTELAEKVGVTKSTIAAYENNSRFPSFDVLVKLSQTFRVSLDEIVFDRSGKSLNVGQLKDEQIWLLEELIEAFERSNSLEKIIIEKYLYKDAKLTHNVIQSILLDIEKEKKK